MDKKLKKKIENKLEEYSWFNDSTGLIVGEEMGKMFKKFGIKKGYTVSKKCWNWKDYFK